MPRQYFRPIVQFDAARSDNSLSLNDTSLWFDTVEVLERDRARGIIAATDLPSDVRTALTTSRVPVCGVPMDAPRIMGILNVTPDSFSDGGDFALHDMAVERSIAMVEQGADILDIGGESTRPGAEFVSETAEIERTAPVIASIASRIAAPISIDTRKGQVAKACVAAGAGLFNDVSALSFDPQSLDIAAELDVPVCLMHASGDPKTMQDDPAYADVLLDVYDYLENRRDAAIGAGVSPDKIILDPGIGFGKTVAHNLALLRGLSLFHALGCPLLLGASRKRFIGTLTGESDAKKRMPGSLAVALEGARQGVQILRVHDVAETRQALTLWTHMAECDLG